MPVTADVRLLRGLGERGLYESVEFFCTKRFTEPISVHEFAALNLERLRILARQGLELPPEERATCFVRLRELENEIDDDLQRRLSTSPTTDSSSRTNDTESAPGEDLELRTLLDAQGAFVRAAWGGLARLEAESLPTTRREPALRGAVELLDEALDRLGRARKTAERERDRVRRQPERFGRQEWAALEMTLRFREGLASRDLALCHAPGSADRLHLLSLAREMLEVPAGLAVDDEEVLRSILALSETNRLLGDYETSQKLLTALSAKTLPREVRWEAAAEQLTLLMDCGQLDMAKAYDAKTSPGPPPEYAPEYALARLDLLLRCWQLDPSEERFAELRDQVRQMETWHGPYWGRRGRLLLDVSLRNGRDELPSEAGLSLAADLAESAYLRGDTEEAIRRYDEAAEAARRGSVWADFLSVSRRTAAVRLDRAGKTESPEERGRLMVEAAGILQTVGTAQTNEPGAAETHLKAVDLTGELVRDGLKTLDDYITLLEEHLRCWPDDTLRTPLLLRCARMLEEKGEYREALRRLAEVPRLAPNVSPKTTASNGRNPDDVATVVARETELLDTAERCFQKREQHEQCDGPEGRAVSDAEAAAFFESRLLPLETWSVGKNVGNGGPQGDDENDRRIRAVQARAAILASESLLRSAKPESSARAEVLLRSVSEGGLRTEEPGSPPWVACRTLFAYALIGCGKEAEALAVFGELDAHIEGLPEPQRRRIALSRGGAFAKIGRKQQAVGIYTELLKDKGNDPEVLRPFAELLTEDGDAQSLNLASKLWKRLEENTPQNSEAWWTAKEGTLRVLRRQGKGDEADRELKLLQLRYPELGGPARKERLR